MRRCVVCACPVGAKKRYCLSCAVERRRALERDRWRQKHDTRTDPRCVRCADEMDLGLNGQRKYCDACKKEVRRETVARYNASHPGQASEAARRSALRRTVIKLRYATCMNCRDTLTLKGGQQLCTKDGCRVWQHRIRMREYMRSTRKAASRYWRFANTPEAHELAETYLELRMELRPNARYKEQWRRYRAAKRSGDSEHALGASAKSANG